MYFSDQSPRFPRFPTMNATTLKYLANHHQHHSVFNSEHLNRIDNSCQRRLEHVWNKFWKRSPNKPDPGRIACNEQKSEEASTSSSATKHGHPLHRQKLQSWTSNYLSCSCASQAFPRDSIAKLSQIRNMSASEFFSTRLREQAA